MACEVCEHCQSPVSRHDKITIREGFSYHKRCHKCYVCSETNLQNAEVFKGVIFCSRCAQRIFQGCSTARRTKNMHTNRGRRTRSRSHRREREKPKNQDWKTDKNGVIELARMAASNTTDSDDPVEKKLKRSSTMAISDRMLQVEKNKRVENCFYYQTMGRIKRDSPEIGTTTDVTQELLKTIITLEDDKTIPRPPAAAPVVPQRRKRYRKKKESHIPIKKKPSCSDPRIAELGVSTEIANMALRKNSEVPVTIRSDTRFKGNTSYTVSVPNIKSDRSGEGEEWIDSAYSTIEESETTNILDKRFKSILKIPLKLFKKKILTRSSLVSVLMSSDTGSMNIIQRIKQILHEEVLDHQVRGIKRLYSTINRRKTPYKLGWVPLINRASRLNLCPEISRETDQSCSYGRRCKHFRQSHSYRCMRAQVMKLAGPTTSELALYRHKIKSFIMPPFIRNMLSINYPAVKLSAACQRSTIASSKKS